MLNVNKKRINNKRLSRLQGVILRVLAIIHPSGYPKRVLPKVVGGLYGKGSIITAKEKGKERPLPDDSPEVLWEKSRSMHQAIVANFGGRDDWTSPKFSVSYSRSILSLLKQGLVHYSYMIDPAYPTERKRGVFISEKGLAKIKDRKVKVKTTEWSLFIKAVNG